MKNVMTYVATLLPRRFDVESECMVKVQIDNSLEIGWTRQQIVLLTDFPFEYNGVQSVVMENHSCSRRHDRNGRSRKRGFNKIVTIMWLYEQGLLDEDIFFHDLDAFQNHEFLDYPDEQYRPFDLAIAPNSNRSCYIACCMFFKSTARPLWEEIYKTASKHGLDEERAIMKLFPPAKQSKEVVMMDISYNIDQHCQVSGFLDGFQPARILHFHPLRRKRLYYRAFVLGANVLNKPLACERVGRLITKHCGS